jgi:hypothetical protein
MRSLQLLTLVFAISTLLWGCKLDKPILPGDPGYVKSTTTGNTTGTGTGTGTTGTGTSTGGTGTGTTTSASYYVKGTLGGKAFDWEVDYTNWGTGDGKNSSTDQNGIETAELDGVISSYTSTSAIPAISIGFRTYQVDLNNQDQTAIIAYFNSYVTTGNWNLATDGILAPSTKKIVFYYNDANGNSYSSEGIQTGSTANITSVKQVPSSSGVRESVDIQLTFSCELYNLNGSGSNIMLTNAQASINIPDQLY